MFLFVVVEVTVVGIQIPTDVRIILWTWPIVKTWVTYNYSRIHISILGCRFSTSISHLTPLQVTILLNNNNNIDISITTLNLKKGKYYGKESYIKLFIWAYAIWGL
jgi:hypothetical protein